MFLGMLGWTRAVQNPVLVYLGRISYGLYVYHILGLKIGYWIFKGHTASVLGYLIFMAGSLSATIFLSIASFRRLLKPLLFLKDSISPVAPLPPSHFPFWPG